MTSSPLSFSATQSLRLKLMAMNLEPYFVKESSAPQINRADVGTKETQWIESPLVNQPDLDNVGLLPQAKLNILNQYGPENGRGPNALFKNLGTKSNQGPFNFQTDSTSKFAESEQEQKELLVLNRFGPQDGWSDASSELEVSILEPTIRDEYVSDSTKPNLFRPSSYSSSQILLDKDPTGSDGLLSQDSVLTQLAATKLRSLFEESIAYEIQQETVGRANGVAALKDPYLGLKIAVGRSPLIEPDWNVTVPDTVIGTAADFISRITGVYSPFSYIPGDYFSPVQPTSLLNQAVNFVTGLFGFPNVLPTRKTASDIFLAYTGQGTKKLLFGSLALNRFVPDYRFNFINQVGLFAPRPNYYIGSRTSDPLDIVSPSGEVPVNEYGEEVETNVYGPSLLGNLYENDIEFKFGLNGTSTIDGGGIQGGFTWVSPKYKGNAGFKVGKGGDAKGFDQNFPPISAQYNNSESTQYALRKGSILDETQRLINSQPGGQKRLQHVGNAIDQVSKVFNDGYKEITKGSRVIRYVDNNGTFVGEEYGRVFAKDIPYYENSKLQKIDGNIRKNPYSILDKTYNLNMYPTLGPDSTSIEGGRVKKYMVSIENLAWRTSRRPGLTYADLPESEKGPNGGRIMWFPPYDLGFSDNSTVSWEPNTFLGRPEDIYTYKGTSRGGSLSFKMVVDHPSIMNLVVNQVLSNSSSSVVADQVLESFFAGLTKFDVYELGKRYQNFSITELQQLQDTINKSSDPEKIKQAVTSNLNKGGTGAGGPMTSNSSVGTQDYKPQLTQYINNSQFYFDYNQTGGASYNESLTSYESNPQFVSIEQSQKTQVENSKNVLTNLANKVKEILNVNPNVKITIVLKSNSSFNESTSVKDSRNSCIEQSILNIVGTNPNLTITKTSGADNDTIAPQTVPCNTNTLNNYDVVSVGCRRVVIQDIIEIPLPNITNPNGGVVTSPSTVVGNIGSQNTLLNQLNNASSNQARNQLQTISKEVLRKLLNESNYFQFVKESNPYVYDSLREKLKFFHPAFHSTTPEGLNSRLTFLMQCTRPGDTIPTKKSDGTFIDKDARNTAFGAPPVCVIRIGDFYHTKAIINSVRFTYDEKTLDLNPEGIGVQPMIVSVSVEFNFIGGQSLRGPVEELQNALSFNFFANTEMYDERATVLDVSAYDKEFIDKTEETGDTARNTNGDYSAEGGEFIGKLKGELKFSATTGENDYQNIVETLLDVSEETYDSTYDKLLQVFNEYNWIILQIYTTNRIYGTGKLESQDVQIFGKSEGYTDKINELFDNLKTSISNKDLTLFKVPSLVNDVNKTSILQTQLNNLVDSKRASFIDNLDSATNDLSQSQIPYVRVIDKLNFLSGNADGIVDKTGIAKIYNTISATTITDLVTDTKLIVQSTGKQIDDLKSTTTQIIPDTTNYSFDSINTIGTTFDNNADKQFCTIFSKDLILDFTTIQTQVLGELNTKPFNTELTKVLRDNYQTKCKQLSTDGKKRFKKEKFTTKLPSDWNKLKKKDRPNGLELQNPQDSAKQEQLLNLYSNSNTNTDNTFNGKVTF